MSTEQNKSIVRRWIEEGWNKANIGLIDPVYAANFVQHDPNVPMPVRSADDLKNYVGAYLTAFPDLHFTVEDLVAEGDRVVWRFNSHATHLGVLMGIPPTGKQALVTGIVIFRLAESRIAEAWVNIDALGMLQQIGVIPAPETAGH